MKITKLIISEDIYFVKTNACQLFEMNYLLSFFPVLPLSTVTLNFQASNLMNKKLTVVTLTSNAYLLGE